MAIIYKKKHFVNIPDVLVVVVLYQPDDVEIDL